MSDTYIANKGGSPNSAPQMPYPLRNVGGSSPTIANDDIITESGDDMVSESGDQLVTE